MIDRNYLKESAAAIGIFLTEKQLEQFAIYAKLLLEWNMKMNLTAIITPQEIVSKHFIDSISLLSVTCPPLSGRVIDVGCGAGFPGVPLKIIRPDFKITLLDSLRKRVSFLEHVVQVLGFKDTFCVHGRAEELGRQEHNRETYDMACSRAVAALRILSEYCLPFVKPGGMFYSYKGPEPESEMKEAEQAVLKLGGEIRGKYPVIIEKNLRHTIIEIKKISQTSTVYPRTQGRITKSPL